MAYPGLSLYKMMILFMLDKITYPLSNTQIVDFLLERNYTDYFHAQEALSDLLEAKHILSESTHRLTLYTITEEGRKTIHSLEGMLDTAIRSEIISYLKENAFTLRSESGIRANYVLSQSGEYEVRLTIIEEGSPLFAMQIFVVSEEEAKRICASFEQKNQEVYLGVMRALLSDRPQG